MSSYYEPDFSRKHEAKTPAGQIIEATVDSLTLGTLGGPAGKLVDRFFENDNNED